MSSSPDQHHAAAETVFARMRSAEVAVDRAIRDLGGLLARLKPSREEGVFSIARLHSLGSQLVTYIAVGRNMADGWERQMSGHQQLAGRRQRPQKTDPDAGQQESWKGSLALRAQVTNRRRT